MSRTGKEIKCFCVHNKFSTVEESVVANVSDKIHKGITLFLDCFMSDYSNERNCAVLLSSASLSWSPSFRATFFLPSCSNSLDGSPPFQFNSLQITIRIHYAIRQEIMTSKATNKTELLVMRSISLAMQRIKNYKNWNVTNHRCPPHDLGPTHRCYSTIRFDYFRTKCMAGITARDGCDSYLSHALHQRA